jgi:hypothetical protein
VGVRIDAYVVDVVALGKLIERPLWHILFDLRRDARTDDILFGVFDPIARTRHHIRPDRVIVRSTGAGRFEQVPDDDLAATPFLQQSTREYLERPHGSGCTLQWLLRELPTIDGYPYAYEITTGHRRGWVCSALAAASPPRGLTPPLYDDLCRLFSRMLKRYQCGFTVKQEDKVPQGLDGFPFVPNEDTLDAMAPYPPRDWERLIELIELLFQCQSNFGPPPGWQTADDEIDWNQYVSQMLGSFLRMRRVELENKYLVSFIG